MDKYYIANLGTNLAQNGASKLVGVQFSRRPPTFGILHLYSRLTDDALPIHSQVAKQETTEPDDGSQVLCLSCLNLADSSAKFETLREIQLDSSEQFVHFDLLDAHDQVLIEGSSNLAVEQQLQASCFMLNVEGNLHSCSLIDGHLEGVLTVSGEGRGSEGKRRRTATISGEETFVDVVLQRAPAPEEALPRRHKQREHSADLLNYSCQFYVHILSDRCYYFYCVRVKQASQAQQQASRAHIEYEPELVSKYPLIAMDERQRSQRSSSLKFVQVLPLFETRPEVVLLKLSDGSAIVLRNCKCIYVDTGQSLVSPMGESSQHKGPAAQCSFVRETDGNQQVVLLNLDPKRHQLTAHSLLIGEDDADDEDDDSRQQLDSKSEKVSQLHSDFAQELENGRRETSDPDKLLPLEPSFELEKCWSIDLASEIGSLSELDGYDEREEKEDSHWTAQRSSEQLVGCLCPFWSPEQLHLRQGGHQQQQQQQHHHLASASALKAWPKFLLLAYKCHLLIFSFEQETVMPFSVVYDRAFLGMEQNATFERAQETEPKSLPNRPMQIEPKSRPRLVHNLKLIGPRPGDALFNFLFLKEKNLYLKSMCQFHQLGLVASISNLGHILAFKISSSKVTRQKSNLYQQQVLDSLRADSLLRDEINKLERTLESLRSDIASLESQSAAFAASATTGANTLMMLSMRSGAEAQSSLAAQGSLARQQQAHKQQQKQEQQKFLDNLEQLLRVQLLEDCRASIGCRYELSIKWPNLIQVSKILVVCDVASCTILAPKLGCKLVKDVQIANGSTAEQLEATLTSGPDSKEETISACWALIELNSGAENVALSVPLLLLDGIESGGQLHVYFVLSESQPQQRQQLDALVHGHQSRNWRILAAASELAINHYHRRSRSSSTIALGPTSKVFKKSLPIRPLQSYRFSSIINPNRAASDARERNSISIEFASCPPTTRSQANAGAASDERDQLGWQTIAGWLAECLDHRHWSQLVANQFNGAIDEQVSEQRIALSFESSFTCCFIEFELAIWGQEKRVVLRLKSDDFIALDLIKRHLLKRATDSSIKLDVKGSNSTVGVQHLRHLLESQFTNIEAIRRASVSLSENERPDEPRDNNQIDLLVETLLDEASHQLDQDNRWPLGSSEHLHLRTNWLERSFKKDIEQLALSGQLAHQKIDEKEAGRKSLDPNCYMIVKCILEVLVQFDKSYGGGVKQPSEGAKQRMLDKLSDLSRDKKFPAEPSSFVDLILKEWKTTKEMG